MTRDTWLKHFEASPEPVQNYLLDEASGEAESAAQTQLGFEHDAWERVMDIVWQVVFEALPIELFQQKLAQVAGDRDKMLVERVVLERVLYPLGDLAVWDVDARLTALGVPASKLQGRLRISVRPMSYGAAVRRIAAEARISLLGEEMVRRLRDILVSSIKRIRTVEQVREILRRPMVDGGLGWSADQVEAYLVTAAHVLQQVPVMSEEEYSQWLQQTQREAEVRRLDDEQAARLKARATAEAEVSAADLRTKPATFASLVEQVVEETVVLANVQGLDEYLAKRLRNVISTRLRGVRNRAQVEEVLARDAKVGGLGQTPAEVTRIADVIDQVYTERHQAIETEERTKVTSFVDEQKKRIEERQQQEAAERDRWYQEKVRSVAQGESGSVSALKALMRGVRVVGPVTDLRTGLTVSVEGGVPSSASVDGVQGSVRLMSLIEELHTMDIERFRRLAKTPDEARNKLLQKFQTLRQESEDRWIEGVKRWRDSPLQQQYLQLVSRAFAAQKTVIEVASELSHDDARGLRPEEVGILIELNQQLTF
jgi:hypothetical protein